MHFPWEEEFQGKDFIAKEKKWHDGEGGWGRKNGLAGEVRLEVERMVAKEAVREKRAEKKEWERIAHNGLMKEQKQKEEEERWRRQGRRGLNWKRRNERESRAMDSRRNKNGKMRRKWQRKWGGNFNEGGGEGESGILNPRRGRGEECEDEGGYPDKARENHSKVQDYCCKEMNRMQGLPATTRTQWRCVPLWQRQQQKNNNID
jgi:hypothetical protein